MIYDCLFERSDSALNPFEMLYDYRFEMTAQFCIRFDMIYDCHFEMTAKNFRTENPFRQRGWLKTS